MKLTDLHYISDMNHYDFKLCQKVIILKKKNSAHKLLLGPVQILERQCSYIIIKTYESTESLINKSISSPYFITKLTSFLILHLLLLLFANYVLLLDIS